MLVSILLFVVFTVLSFLFCFALDRFVHSRFPDDGRIWLLPWFLFGDLVSLLAHCIFF